MKGPSANSYFRLEVIRQRNNVTTIATVLVAMLVLVLLVGCQSSTNEPPVNLPSPVKISLPGLEDVPQADQSVLDQTTLGWMLVEYQVTSMPFVGETLLLVDPAGTIYRLTDLSSSGVTLTGGTWTAGSRTATVGVADSSGSVVPTQIDLLTGEMSHSEGLVLEPNLIRNADQTLGIRTKANNRLNAEYDVVDLATGESHLQSWQGRVCGDPAWVSNTEVVVTCADGAAMVPPTVQDNPVRMLVDVTTGTVRSTRKLDTGDTWLAETSNFNGPAGFATGWAIPTAATADAERPHYNCGLQLYAVDSAGTQPLAVGSVNDQAVEVLAMVEQTAYLWVHSTCRSAMVGSLLKYDTQTQTSATLINQPQIGGWFTAVPAT